MYFGGKQAASGRFYSMVPHKMLPDKRLVTASHYFHKAPGLSSHAGSGLDHHVNPDNIWLKPLKILFLLLSSVFLLRQIAFSIIDLDYLPLLADS